MNNRLKAASRRVSASERSVGMIVEEFVDAVIRHGVATESGDHGTTNKQYKRYDRLRKLLEQQGDAGRDAIRGLLRHPSPWVRMVAASTCLKFDEKEATRILEALEKETGIVGFDAKMVLREWRAERRRP
jgi:Domain of unknown function (DUF2019)